MRIKHAAKTITMTLEAEGVARAVVEHCRREMGMILPGDSGESGNSGHSGGRVCAMLLVADGRSVRKLKVVVTRV